MRAAEAILAGCRPSMSAQISRRGCPGRKAGCEHHYRILGLWSLSQHVPHASCSHAVGGLMQICRWLQLWLLRAEHILANALQVQAALSTKPDVSISHNSPVATWAAPHTDCLCQLLHVHHARLVATRVRQPPGIPQGLSPSPLSAGRHGAAPSHFAHV